MKQRLAALLLTLLLALSALPIRTLAAPTPEPTMTLEPTAAAEPAPEGEPAAPTPEPAFVGDPAEEPAPDIMVFIDGTTVAGGAYGDHIRWKLSDQGLLTVYGAGAMPDFAGEADMPWAERRGQITALTVEPGITRIGARSFFGCSALQTASLPASVTAVGSNAFSGCAALSEARYAGTEEAWARVRIDGGNEPLQSASKSFGTETPPVVPVENIVAEGSCGGRVFWKLDDQGVLTVFGEGEFWGVPEDEVNNRWDAPWFDKLRDQVRTAVIEPGVTSVGARAFLDCKNLTAVRIADTVTAIGDYAFSMCTGLTDVTLPDSVTWIGTSAFSVCLNVTSIDLSDSLLLIGEAAFCGCERLTDVKLPDGLLAIDNRAFEGCIRLARITIPDSVIRMGAYAFHDCNALQTAVLGKGLDRIEAHMFHHCDRLQSVTISESVAWIEEYAFDDCFALTDVYYGGTQEAWKWVSVMKYNEPFLGARMHYGTEDSPYGGYPLVETPAAVLQATETPTPEPTKAPTPESIEAPTPEPTKAPTPEPTEAPTPEPAGAYGTVKADGAGVLCTLLGRGETLRLTGERGEYYIALLDGQTVWVEKRLVRADGEEPFAAWDGYARKNAAVYAAPYPEGEPAAVLQQNTRVRVVDALGDLLLIEWDDGRQGCVREAQISKKRISGGGPGGADGGDIVLGWRAPAPRGATRLDAKKMDTAFVPCGGTVRCSGTEAYRFLFGRGDRVVVTGGEGALCIVLADGAEGSLPARLVRMDDAPAYEPWTGYAVSKARLFGDWRLCGPATTLDKNTEVRVLDDLGGCYLAEAGGTTGYLASDEVQTERIRSSGGSGGEWTEPVL